MEKKETMTKNLTTSQNETTVLNGENLNEFQKIALEKAEKELEDLKKEYDTKKYLIDLNKEDITLLENFNAKDAPWKFTECLGIIEVEKELASACNTGKLFISAIAIEAIYYYLSKVEGRGKYPNTESFERVEDYIRVMKGITSGMERVKADNDNIRRAEFVVASRREGLALDESAI